MATQVGALYAFFNASVQGTARIAETLFEQHGGDIKNVRLSKKGKQIVLGGIMLGSMQALLLAAAGYDDDEPPEFIRERNLILPVGDGKYLTLAMPLGLHVIPGIGRIATEFVLSGGKDPLKRIAAFGSMFADAFNPVGSAGWSLQTITPSVVDPFAALDENKDFTGKEIYREDFNKLSPTPGHADIGIPEGDVTDTGHGAGAPCGGDVIGGGAGWPAPRSPAARCGCPWHRPGQWCGRGPADAAAA